MSPGRAGGAQAAAPEPRSASRGVSAGPLPVLKELEGLPRPCRGRLWHALPALVLLVGCDACLSRRPLDDPPTVPAYPDCPGPAPGAGGAIDELSEEVEIQTTLRPGPLLRERRLWERTTVLRKGCLRFARVRQVTPLATTDVEVVYDAEDDRPLRAWRRTALHDFPERTTTELFELRNDPPVVVRNLPDGTTEYLELVGPRPVAVVGPGRGILTVWIRRADLVPGEIVRGPVLDLTEQGKIDDEGSLRREADREVDGEQRQVYRVYGRDAVFADESGRVVGDLAGMRPADQVEGPAPPTPPAELSPPDPRAPLRP